MDEIIIDNLNCDNIIQNLSMNIKKNTFTTISGPNNSGKTTLLRILNREIIVDNQILISNIPLNDYKINTFESILQCVIPLEVYFQEKVVREELYLHNPDYENKEELLKKLKLKKIINKPIDSLNTRDIIKLQLVIALIQKPKILLIDSLTPYFTEEELLEILDLLKEYQEENNMTMIYMTINLKECIKSDYLFILSNGCIALEGVPLEVLEKDNIIKNAGLDLPFMIDLSVKLRDYELTDEIELDINRMVDKLWN